MILQEESFLDALPTDERLKKVRIIVVNVPCSKSGVVNPVDFVLQEGIAASIKELARGNIDSSKVNSRILMLKSRLTKATCQGHPTSIFGKYLLTFGKRFEIWNFRNICCKISCLPACPRIFEHLKNGIIAHF